MAEENNIGKINPLLMESIIETVFSFIPTQYLNDCGLVNKMWNKEARRARRYRHAINLDTIGSVENMLERFERDRNVWISECHLRCISLDHPAVQKLIPKLAPKLTFLDIQDCTGAEETLHEMIRSLPNLIKLEIGTTKTNYGLYHRKFPIFEKSKRTKEMQFPKIKSLEVLSYNDDKYMRTLLSSIVRAFPNLVRLITYNMFPEDPIVFKNLRLPHLTFLDFNMMAGSAVNGKGGMTDKHLECLLAMNLNLRTLFIFNVMADLKVDLLRKFLESQQNLTDLELLQKSEIDPSASVPLSVCPFPLALPKLREFKVSRAFVRNFGHILTSCPELQSVGFEFEPMDAKWDRILPKNPLLPHGLNAATFSWIDDKALSKLSHTFKNLSRLKIHECDDSVLRVIFTEFTHVKALSLYGQENSGEPSMTETGLTGIPDNLLPTDKFSDTIDVSSIRTFPYIGNMTALTELYLASYSGVSENVIWYGVKDILSNLTLISIKGVTADNPWSEELLAALEKSFSTVKCPISNGDDNEEDDVEIGLDKWDYVFISKKKIRFSMDEDDE